MKMNNAQNDYFSQCAQNSSTSHILPVCSFKTDSSTLDGTNTGLI